MPAYTFINKDGITATICATNEQQAYNALVETSGDNSFVFQFSKPILWGAHSRKRMRYIRNRKPDVRVNKRTRNIHALKSTK